MYRVFSDHFKLRSEETVEMEKKFVFLIVCMLIMTGSAMALTVADASFEDHGCLTGTSYVYVAAGTSGWTDASAEVSGGNAWIFGLIYSSGKPQVTHSGCNMMEEGGIKQIITGATAGMEYELSIYAAGASSSEGWTAYIDGVSLGFQGTSGIIPQVVGDWELLTWNFTAPSSSFELKFLGGETAWIDDVSITAVIGTSVIITETLGSTEVDEAGGTDSYDMVLQSSPANDVQVTATPGDSQIDIGSGPGIARVLTFTADPGGDWDILQTITVTADDDAVHEPDDDPHTTVITHTSQSDDSDYDDIPINSVSVAVYDDELGCGDWGYLDADINNDCYVDMLDLLEIARNWLP
jgi:hypothetical protein